MRVYCFVVFGFVIFYRNVIVIVRELKSRLLDNKKARLLPFFMLMVVAVLFPNGGCQEDATVRPLHNFARKLC